MHKKELCNIKVPRQLAKLLRIYCVLNSITVREFATVIIEKELKPFREELNEIRKLNKIQF